MFGRYKLKSTNIAISRQIRFEEKIEIGVQIEVEEQNKIEY